MSENAQGVGWNKIYYALGAFAVFSTGAAVYLSHVLVSDYARSVEINQTWAERSARYSDWGGIASEGNAPGNDVFESGDVPGESAKLEEIVARFEAHHAALLKDLEAIEGGTAAGLGPKIAAAREAFLGQVQEARAIFAAFNEGDRDKAGRHMASMDRYNAQTAAELGVLVKEVQQIQGRLFAEQLDGAARVQTWEYGLIVLVLLMVGFTVAYGQKLSSIFREAQARIDRRNRDLRLVLDNVGEGLVTVGLDGSVSAESSAELTRIFGPRAAEERIWEVVGRGDAGVAASLELGFEGLREGFMPYEVTLGQMPSRVRVGARLVMLTFRPILRSGEVQSVLLVARDVTEQVAQEEREARQAELLQLFNRVAHDRIGVIEFHREGGQLVTTLVEGAGQLPLPVAKRLLHTLKGNAGFFGLKRLAFAVHHLEDAAEDTGDWSAHGATALRDAWKEADSMIRHLLGDTHRHLIEVEPDELQSAVAIAERASAPLVVRALKSWQHERLSPRLERMEEQVKSLATRLGKEVEVRVDVGVRRLDSQGWEPFWASLTHVLRNAVDHGLESPAERIAAGKDPVGQIVLRASSCPQGFVLEVEDDGRGIDWEKLAARARERGLPADTDADLQHVLFTGGISTADQVTDISGRGIGMAAVAHVTGSLGGEVSVQSVRGKGTCLRFDLPLAVHHEARAAA